MKPTKIIALVSINKNVYEGKLKKLFVQLTISTKIVRLLYHKKRTSYNSSEKLQII